MPTIQLHIQAETPQEIQDVLRGLVIQAEAPIVSEVTEVIEIQGDDDNATVVVAAPQKRGRGRPRTTSAAPPPQPEPTSQPEVSTTPAADPPPVPAATAAASASSSNGSEGEASAPKVSPAGLTETQVRAKLQEVASSGSNGAGMEEVTRIIKSFGYQKVKEIKPEHFAQIIVEANKYLKG